MLPKVMEKDMQAYDRDPRHAACTGAVLKQDEAVQRLESLRSRPGELTHQISCTIANVNGNEKNEIAIWIVTMADMASASPPIWRARA